MAKGIRRWAFMSTGYHTTMRAARRFERQLSTLGSLFLDVSRRERGQDTEKKFFDVFCILCFTEKATGERQSDLELCFSISPFSCFFFLSMPS